MLAAPATSHPRYLSGLPKIVASTDTPVVGALQGGVEGSLLGALLGLAVGAAVEYPGIGAAIGAGVGAIAGAGVGYAQAKSTAAASYTLTLTLVPGQMSAQTLSLSGTYGLQLVPPAGGSLTTATTPTTTVVGATGNGLFIAAQTGSVTVTATWIDVSGTNQTSTIPVTVTT